MHVIILRHGEAERQTSPDAKRRLTPRGHSDTRRAGVWLARQPVTPDRLIASSLVRAQQSAQEVQQAFPRLRLETKDLLVPEGDPARLLSWLEQQGAETLLLVSHLPLASDLVALMVDGVAAGGPPLDTASMVCVELDPVAPGCGQLRWLQHASDYGDAQ